MSGLGGPLACALLAEEALAWPLDPRRAEELAEVESYVTGEQRPLEFLGGAGDPAAASAEQRVAAVLAADPVCLGRVAGRTVRDLAWLIVTPPAALAIDGAAERRDVLAYLDRRRANAATIASTGFGDDSFARDRARQIAVEISDISQGLHEGAAVVAAALAQQRGPSSGSGQSEEK